EVLDLYLAEGVKPIEGEAPHADWEEQGMEVVRLPFEEALRRATGPPGDAKTWSRSACTGSSWPGRGHPTRRTGRPRTPRPAGRPPGLPDRPGPVS
ncbi:MAG TPA: hypothetical protein VFJ69_14075, partial [Actinomycetota bacterium]|nr:hypothetical protein [Actinomycetota bacterium]